MAKALGRRVVMMRLTVNDVLDELVYLGLKCTPAGIGLSLRSIFERRVKSGLDPSTGEKLR